MILPVIPVSDVDLSLATMMAQRMAKHNEVYPRVLVAFSRMASWDRDPLIMLLRSSFHDVHYFTLPTENENGWPESATHMFYSVVEHLEWIKNDKPWYFLEADNAPLRPGWLTALNEEYDRVGKPYMGVINKTRYRNTQTGETYFRGQHMVGTGIYPADFARRCRSVHYMSRLPFDICIEEEVVPECHDTKLIAHRWSTVNYRLENGYIMMDDQDPGHHYAAPVPPEAVIVHGCKDGSIYSLLDQRDGTA